MTPIPPPPRQRTAPPQAVPLNPDAPAEPREHAIQNAILRAFATRSDMRLWRANCGVAVMGCGPQARKVRFGIPGQADLSGIIAVAVIDADGRLGATARYSECIPIGLRLEIEVKSLKGRQRPEQRNFQAMIEKFGGLYILARSVDDVHAALEQAIDGYQR